jgi:peptidoglycan/xylan/chitin deacetylase (PgdA/CDA1 family)
VGRAAAAPLTETPRVTASNSTAGFVFKKGYPQRAAFSMPPAPRGKVVYLTFDDGPTRYTNKVLTLLDQYNAKATFFVIGEQVRQGPATIRRAYREGHAVENHTWSHPSLKGLTRAQFRSQVARTNAAIRKATGDAPECLRPPYGITSRTVLARAQRLRMPVVMWSVDSRDWAKPGAPKIARKVLKNVKDGSIVLMHDGGGKRGQTVAALKTILPQLKKRGYTMLALPCGRNG